MALWRHQEEIPEFVRDKDGVLLWWGMSSGKSYATINIIKVFRYNFALIICPKVVIKTWKKEFAKHAPGEFFIIAPETGSVAKKAKDISQQIEYYKDKKKIVVVLNYESAWRPHLGEVRDKKKNIINHGLLKKYTWDLVVCDECFVENTLIDTPDGQKYIQELKVGDKVFGYDHKNKKVISTTVKNTMQNIASPKNLCYINNERCTSNHPYFTEKGYINARDITDQTILFKRTQNNNLINTTLQELRQTINTTTGNKYKVKNKYNKQNISKWLFLFKNMFKCLEKKQLQQNQSQSIFRTRQNRSVCKNDTDLVKSRIKNKRESNSKSKFKRESIGKEQNRIIKESSQKTFSNGLSNVKWWKWNWIDKATKNIIQVIKEKSISILGNRRYNQNWLWQNLSYSIQSGYFVQKTQNSNRMRWKFPFNIKPYKKRQKERSVFNIDWIYNNEIHKQPDIDKSDESIQVYNIETGTNNYFVNGILVHNCQKISAVSSKVSVFVAKLKSTKRLGLSGTPFAKPEKSYGIYRFLDKSIFGIEMPSGRLSHSFQRWKNQYCQMGGYENREVIKYINVEELNQKINSIAHRVKTEDVIELPDIQHIFIQCELNRNARKAYDVFKKEAILEFQNGEELTADNVLTKYLRLAQIASGTIKDDEGHEHHIDDSKLQELKILIQGIDEPIVIYTWFRSEVVQVMKMIKAASREDGIQRSVAKIVGGCNEEDKFESGQANIAVVNIATGGVGLNGLVRSRHAIYYSTGYNNLDYEQSLARVRRHGSDLTKKVIYYHLTATNTIDEVIKNAIERKINIVSAVMDNFQSELL
jgi:hypothetical protein